MGTTMTEKELQKALPDASMTGSIRPWISSLKNPKYPPAGQSTVIDIQRRKLEGGGIVYERVA